MRTSFWRSKVLCCTAALLFVPQMAFSASPTSVKMMDVVLHEGGVMVGQLVDAQAKPLAGRQVSLRQAAQVVATVETDKNGQFAVRGLRSGIYGLESGNSRGMVAAWNANAAPPTAHQAVMLTSSDGVVRGQLPLENEGCGIGWAEAAGLGLGTAGVIIGIIALDDDAS